jgi:uncharacterized protein YbjT (DUF2867 family)
MFVYTNIKTTNKTLNKHTMKYVVTGGAGHITKPAAEKLLAAGHQVVIVSRSAENVKELVAKGASAAVGSIEDETFVKNAFAGADAVYLMIPPNFSPGPSWRAYQNKVADIYVNAVKANNIKNVVMLSSIGAHMGNGAGPIDGLADMEKKLGALENVNVKFLRPSYFYYNLFSMIPLVKNMNIAGSNFGNSGEKLVLTHTSDIAEALSDELLHLNFTGHSSRYIASDEKDVNDIAAVLGNAVGKPGVAWVTFTDEQALEGMLQAGLQQSIAEGYVQMGKSLRTGQIQEDYWKNKPVLGKVKLEDFAKEFAAAFNA